MQRKIEGIILSKTPFRERDVICRLLLRNGKKVGVLFFGGRGGGKKQSPSTLELGHLMEVTLQFRRHIEGNDLYLAKEWIPKWTHQFIRKSYLAYSLCCSYFEALDKISPQDDLHFPPGEEEFMGIFRVASNAIYYLEESLKNNCFQLSSHFFLFFSKLLFELGIAPNLSNCLFCEKGLEGEGSLQFLPDQGGFSCFQCSQSEESRAPNDREILKGLSHVHQMKYSQYENFPAPSVPAGNQIFYYFCYQFQLEQKNFKTLRFFSSGEKY